ncbi:MAG: glycosyltransferase [Anaerolineales bacterium]|nr:glycosyltransferase [Anaerolineales bacterium]
MQDNSLAHVLMVAYNYPPLENTGITRTVKFAKYLPEFGYCAVILTTQTYGDLPDDAATLTFRADDLLGSFKRTYLAFKQKQGTLNRHANIRLLPPGSRLEQWKSTYLVPDPKIIWYPPALRLAQKIIRTHPIRRLYSTSPPETSHLIAMKLKQETGLPWVADFRDGWLFEPHISTRLTSRLRYRLEAGLERKVLLSADRVITVNQVIADDMARRCPGAAAKISVIPNGFDQDDFAPLHRQATRPDKFRVVHTGALSLSREGRTISGLLQALRAMQASQLDMMARLEILMVGDLTAAETRMVEQSDVKQYFRLTGPLSYPEALQHQIDADILLLVTAPGKAGATTSKLFEYLASGRPILALSSPSDAGDLISTLGAGVVVEPADAAGIQQALQAFYQQWQAGQLPTHRDARVCQFDRRELTRQLACLFDETAVA